MYTCESSRELVCNNHKNIDLTFHPCWLSFWQRMGRSHCRSSPCCLWCHWLWWRGPGCRPKPPAWRCSPGWEGWGRTRHGPPGRGWAVRSGAAMQVWSWWAGPGSDCSDSSDSGREPLLMQSCMLTAGHLEEERKHIEDMLTLSLQSHYRQKELTESHTLHPGQPNISKIKGQSLIHNVSILKRIINMYTDPYIHTYLWCECVWLFIIIFGRIRPYSSCCKHNLLPKILLWDKVFVYAPKWRLLA